MDSFNNSEQNSVLIPFDLSLAPEAFLVDNAPSQDLIRCISDSILTLEQCIRADFFSKPSFHLKLEHLRDVYNDKHSRVTIASLATYSSVNLDPNVSTSLHGMAIIWGILFLRVALFIYHSKEDIDFSDRNNPTLIT